MKGVLLDTVGLIAVWDSSDQWHAAAESRFNQLLQDNVPLVSTEQIFFECGNAAARRPYRRRVSALRRQLADAGLLCQLTEEEIEMAWAAFDGGHAANAGIIDQTSFIVMRRLGLRQAFTNDAHFAAAGFETLF